MRCNWFPKASCISYSFASHRLVHNALRLSRTSQSFVSSPILRKLPELVLHRSVTTQAAAIAPPVVLPTPAVQETREAEATERLTPAQLSRAAWESIRLALQAHDLHTAYLIAESVRLSNKPLLHNTPSKHYRATGIEFFEPVSQRLCGHALVHGLVRLGLPRRAHASMKIMMDNGVRIHTKTLETVLEALVTSDGKVPRSSGQEYLDLLKNLLPKHQVLNLHPSVTAGRGSRAAFDLFETARKQRQERTERMYRTIIGACLLHGELIAATLLFTIIIRDCAVRDALGRQLNSPGIEEEPKIEQQTLDHFRRLRTVSPLPSLRLFQDMVASIAAVLSRTTDAEDDAYQISFRAALQALANLAAMLDFRQIPYTHLSSLISILYNCPKCDDVVWIVGKDKKPVQVKAYDYFHRVLKGLILSPPELADERRRHSGSKGLVPVKNLLVWQPICYNPRPLDLASCNSLLHYALRHRLSPPLANRVLEYMQNPNWPRQFPKPKPNVVTYNILLSSGRLLRSPAMAETVLQLFRSKDISGLGTIHSQSPLPVPSQLDLTQGRSRSRFSRSLRHLSSSDHTLSIPPPRTTDDLRADSHTINAYISYLIATGRPHLVSDILFELLPELSIIDDPSWINLTHQEIQDIRRKSRYDSLRRVVAYGPYFFVAILNAAVKAGRTGLAERVWHLAKEAERASWLPEFHENGVIQPWCLPVHAYTLMITCYADEVMRGRSVAPDTAAGWKARADISKRFVVGWARSGLRRSYPPKGMPASRAEAGRGSAVSLYESMFRGAKEVYQALSRFEEDKDAEVRRAGLEVPRPDARFFNAMMRIVSMNPRAKPRRARTASSHWRQHLRFGHWLYARYGQTAAKDNEHVLELAQDMVRAGYALPLGMRYLLIGIGSQELLRGTKTVVNHRRGPWAYPRWSVKGPFTLFVEKEKGLPLGRSPRRYKSRLKPLTSMSNANG